MKKIWMVVLLCGTLGVFGSCGNTTGVTLSNEEKTAVANETVDAIFAPVSSILKMTSSMKMKSLSTLEMVDLMKMTSTNTSNNVIASILLQTNSENGVSVSENWLRFKLEVLGYYNSNAIALVDGHINIDLSVQALKNGVVVPLPDYKLSDVKIGSSAPKFPDPPAELFTKVISEGKTNYNVNFDTNTASLGVSIYGIIDINIVGLLMETFKYKMSFGKSKTEPLTLTGPRLPSGKLGVGVKGYFAYESIVGMQNVEAIGMTYDIVVEEGATNAKMIYPKGTMTGTVTVKNKGDVQFIITYDGTDQAVVDVGGYKITKTLPGPDSSTL